MIAMKTSTVLFLTIILLSSCSSIRMSRTERELARAIEAQQLRSQVETMVESGSFILLFDQTQSQTGNITQLNMQFNHITIDKTNIEMALAYTGRQYGTRPVAAINLQGKASVYNIEKNIHDGSYLINFQVTQGRSTFTVSINIAANGTCRALVINDRIEPVEYKGSLAFQNVN